ncbi:MAG: DUF2723 domain-containing protein, partial [Candidatus Krumholzibacteria bacterium]|nr:DUF2723 domain-containing protein [Candidatus Krumholzibacteria bacterium]
MNRQRYDFRRPVGLLLTVFAAFFALYLWTSAPSVMFYDSGELQAVALEGGISHPSGYPSYIMAGNLFGRILPGDRAHRITVMSAFFGALTVCMLLLIIRRLGVPALYAASGAAAFGLTLTFWSAAIRAEVYTLSCFVFCSGLLLTLRALENPRVSRLLSAGLLLGLTMTNHFMFTIGAAFLMIVLAARTPAEDRTRAAHMATLLAGFLLGLTPYLYLFWADGANLPLNYIDYTVEAGAGQHGFDAGSIKDPLKRIFWLVSCREYTRNVTGLRAGQIAWQARHLGIVEFGYHYGPFSIPLLLIGILDLRRILSRNRIVMPGLLLLSPLFALLFAKTGMIP